MERGVIEKFLEHLVYIAGEQEGSWQEKRDAVLAQCDDVERSAIAEFVSWFENPVEHEVGPL